MKKVKVMNMMDFDIIKVPLKSILFDVRDLIRDGLSSEKAIIIETMLYSLESTHPFAKIAIENTADELDNKEKASWALAKVIEFTANKYVPLIQFNQEKLDEILTLDRKTTSNVDRNVVQDRLDDAATDSSIRKFNDTPNAGANPDLLDDTYLSESERNTTSLGERSSNVNQDLSEEGTTLTEDNIERAKILVQLDQMIKDYYSMWIRDIDKAILVI